MSKVTQDIEKKIVKKKTPSFAKGFISSAILFLLISIMFIAAIYFNLGNFRQKTIEILEIEKAQKEMLAVKQLELDAANKFLQDALTKLAADQTKLKNETDNIDKEKIENNKIKASLTSGKLKSDQVIAIYELMEPQKVADIFSIETDTQIIQQILKNMDEKKVAQIISLMPPVKAASLLSDIAN